MRAVLVALSLLLGACAADSGGRSIRPEVAPVPVPVALPVPRTEVAGATWRSSIVVLGGLTAAGEASARVDRTGGGGWRRMPDLPVALHHTAAVVVKDRLFVLGGYTMDGPTWRESAKVFSIGFADDAWRNEPSLPAPRGAHAAAVLDERIVVVGGVSGGAVTATTTSFGPEGWKPGPSLRQAREHLAATTANGVVYAIAGRIGATNFTNVETWDGEAAGWSKAPSLNKSRGGIAAATLADRRPCVAGGEEEGGTIGSVECLEGSAWETSAQLRMPRHGLAVVSSGKALHVIAGGPQPGLTVSDTHEVFTDL